MFTYHSKQSAPRESLPLIEQSIATYGFLPKLHQVLADAPASYQAYLATFDLFQSKTTLTPIEQQIVMMTANFDNRCHYCTAGHSMLMKMAGMPTDYIEALREGRQLPDPRHEALRTFTHELLESRGHVGDERLDAFLKAGYSRRQALEVLTGLAAKLISNFTNALAHTELDEPVKAFAWEHPSHRAALKAS
jgi:alkylhydroperoxidase family enzyme